MNHTCTLDDRGICNICANIEREHDHDAADMTIAQIFADRIPNNFEFPDPYEFGIMENGEWN